MPSTSAESTTKMSSIQSLLLPVQPEIEKMETHLFQLLDSQVPFVRSVAEYILKNGGKRLRPILTVVASKMSGYTGEKAYNMAGCIEFIHTASLLHDDVIDKAEIRRGKPSANAKWGNHVSVLVGDFFYCRASQLLTDQGDLKILKVVTDSITALTEGEVLEIVTNNDYHTDHQTYLEIIKNKTALLFAAACQVGGLLGGVSEELEKALRDYGYHLGMAFQLADDALDYMASEDVFGKASGIDLQEGKLTMPLIVAVKQATQEEQKLIKNALLSDKVDAETFKAVYQIIKKYDGFEKTYELAKDFIMRAKKSLGPFRHSIEKEILLSLADYVVERDR